MITFTGLTMKHTAVIIFRTVILLLLGVVIGIIISNGSFSGHSADFYTAGDSKADQVLHLLKTTYVDSVNTDTIEAAAIDNMLQTLDPHSLYLPAQQAASLNDRLEGGFDGVGIAYLLLRDTLTVTEVYPGGPAARAGISNGDKVITVNSRPFAGTHLTLERVWTLFKGQANTSIRLGILRWNNKQVTNYTITRGRVVLSSLDAWYKPASTVGYIKISKFASTTDADFRAALKQLTAQGAQKLILDLRGNGGGYLNAATALADEFLPKDKLIVYTRGAHERRTDYFATDSGRFQQGRVAVLIDEHSASASEILAGALQDWDRAVIVGRRSFGKGLVQEQFPFSDGSAVNLTVARYYTPSGRSIQKSYKNGTEEYRNDLQERLQRGELYGLKNRFTDSVLKTTAGYHTAAGRKLYSGGGIMPDVFAAENRAVSSPLIKELNSSQLFTCYAADRLQPLLSKYPSAGAFATQYSVSDADLSAFLLYASRTLKQMDSQEIRASAEYIKLLIKAGAIRLKWGNAAYYQLLNSRDEDVKAAINAVN